jgi:hypothetical protein
MTPTIIVDKRRSMAANTPRQLGQAGSAPNWPRRFQETWHPKDRFVLDVILGKT